MIRNGSKLDSGIARSYSDLLELNSSPEHLPEVIASITAMNFLNMGYCI